MQAVCETFLRKHLSKSPFSVKTVVELVTLVKSSGVPRDTATVVKIVQDMYALDFVREHLKTLPVPVRERLDKFMANNLDDFIALMEDSVVAVKSSNIGCFPLLCGMKSVTVVEQLGEKIATEKAVAAAVAAEKVAVEKLATDIANKVVAEAVADVSGSVVAVDVSGAVTTAAVEVQVIAPVVAEVPPVQSSSEPASSVPEAKTDVSGAPVETTPA